MTTLWTRRGRYAAAGVALLSATLIPGLVQMPADAGAAPASTVATADRPNLAETLTTIGDPIKALATIDTRGKALPSLLQKQAAARLGDVDLRWNRFGTPASILPADGVLAKATSQDPVQAARTWLRRNHALFGITQAQVTGMEAIDQPLVYSKNHAVFFRQRFGGLLPAIGSAVTVAVGDGKVVYVSSSITKTTQQIPTATLSPAAGWLKAAENVGLDLPVDLGSIVRTVSGGWTRLNVPGILQEQQVRVRALANADGSVRPVLEANVVDVQGGESTAYTVLVDGLSGAILHRENKVLNFDTSASSASTVALQAGVQSGLQAPPASNGTFPFMGSITATACGPKHPFELADGQTKTVAAVATAVNASNDITINLYGPDDTVIASQDLLTSPEALTYTADSIPAGTYSVEVCPFAGAAFLPPGNYAITVVTTNQGASTGGTSGRNPKWRFFPANPTLDSPTQTPKNAVVGCWLTAPGCTLKTGRFNNVAAISPWDTLPTAPTVSTMTTKGNNALTTEAWASPLTPGGLLQAPVSATGSYTTQFTDAWNNSQCDPLELVPGGNDILFSVGNLFVTHNRMHDYSYYLGFTEKAYNMQVDNTGRGGTGADPEVGNVQAGAIGGQVSGLGRDNANQIALQDGVPGITNQYLFQPIAGAFYSPCTDGGLDMGIVGHEYTHAISNRMVGGPDEGLTSEQGGAMGESWSDQVAAEFQFSHGYSNGGNVWAVGAYATGNKTVAIRDYAINHNPLNYSNYGFDSTGPEVHADGEIWNGTQWEVRQALVKKYNKRYPYTDKQLQLLCAQGRPTKGVQLPYTCPGNRRWIQLIFDSFLFQQGATSMLDARDGMIAADQLRFGGANKSTLWDAFARRGMGVGAKAVDGEDVAPTPSFKSIGGKKRNVKVVFKGKVGDKYYVGDYEQRSRPVANLAKKTSRSVYFTPGSYDMLYVGKKSGHQRFHLVVKKGQKTKVVKVKGSTNYAASANGAKVLGTTGGESRNPQYAIDGTELNGWGVVSTDNVDATKPTISIDLAGSKPVTIRSLAVSASLRPAWPGDDTAGSRFTALRQFAVEACVKSCSSAGAKWKRFYTSPANAFPSVRPRPVAPNLNMRAFQTKPTKATALRLVVLENQCSGFAGYAGELDTDPLNATDCKTGSDRGTIAHVTELQAFSTVPKASDWKSSYGIDDANRFFALKK